jgi:hypothetical protein
VGSLESCQYFIVKMGWNFFKKSTTKVNWMCEQCGEKFGSKKETEAHEKTCKNSEKPNSIKNPQLIASINELQHAAKIKKEKSTLGPKYFKQEAKDFAERKSLIFKKDFDYSIKSLKALDETIDTHWTKDRFKDAVFGQRNNIDNLAYTGVVLGFGSYFGEVFIKHLNGKWVKNKQPGLRKWVIEAHGNKINIFHIIEDCFKEPSKCWFTYKITKDSINK